MAIWVIRDGTESDWKYIEWLRRLESDTLGFLPAQVYLSILNRASIDGRVRWLYSRILIYEDDGVPTGFCYVSFASEPARVFQIAVQPDARRLLRASRLLAVAEQDAIQRGRLAMRARVAADLEANAFWRALGYSPIAVRRSTWLNHRRAYSNRAIVLYEKILQPALFELPATSLWRQNDIGSGWSGKAPQPNKVVFVDTTSGGC